MTVTQETIPQPGQERNVIGAGGFKDFMKNEERWTPGLSLERFPGRYSMGLRERDVYLLKRRLLN